MTTPRTAGIHHITAVASDPQQNLDFYTAVLGLRLVKRTVNFDDPGTYHLYFADHHGSPGAVLTFFPWPGAKRGTLGSGAVSATTFAVPIGSIEHWQRRLTRLGVSSAHVLERWGARVLPFQDHDGTALELAETDSPPHLEPWDLADVDPAIAIRGFHAATLTLRRTEHTLAVLTELLGYTLQDQHGPRTRLVADAPPGAIARHLDLLHDPDAPPSRLGAGIVHHIALRAATNVDQETWLDALNRRGLHASDLRDRTYFRSIYAREPGGVLLEIATDGPGFTIDEPLHALGAGLKLPPPFERQRPAIEQHVPPITIPAPAAPDLATHLHRFDATPSDSPRRTLILLHGTGGNERDLLSLGRAIDPHADLLSPKGNIDENGSARFFRRLAEGVFDLQDLNARAKQLAAWLIAALRAYRIDPARAAIVGFSNGANIAAAMILKRLSPIPAAALLRPMLPFDPEPAAPLLGTRVLILRGSADTIIDPASTDRLERALAAAGVDLTTHTIDATHTLVQDDLAALRRWLQTTIPIPTAT